MVEAAYPSELHQRGQEVVALRTDLLPGMEGHRRGRMEARRLQKDPKQEAERRKDLLEVAEHHNLVVAVLHVLHIHRERGQVDLAGIRLAGGILQVH